MVVLGSGLPLAPEARAEDFMAEVRAINGSNNNLAHPDWGTPGSHLLREASGTHYADGISAMARPNGPSARAVSSAVFPQQGLLVSHLGISDYIWTFGQFLDHDFSLTEGAAFDGRTDAFIPIPTGDVFFDPFGTGTQLMPFHRGLFDASTGITTPRLQINELTAYIDGSNIYGADDQRAAWLRSGTGGKLKVTHTTVGDLAPFNDGTQGNAGSPERPDPSTSLFVAGDIRINEQPTLACMHILFIREHNWQADRIAANHPSWTDDQIFQAARRIVIAELQHITIDEFVPALFGNAAGIGKYTGYDPNVNPGISAVFSTGAYRVGHTLLSPSIQRLDASGQSIPEGPLRLRDSFFAAAPPLVTAHGIEPFLRGVAAQKSQELDNKVIDEVRNFLFGLPGAGGLDLISLNLQRGRDMGLPDFNTVRQDFGLSRVTSFSQITKDQALAATLQQLYGDVDSIDPFAGMFAEDHFPGYNLGQTLLAVFTDQFKRARAGDRFWYERTLNGDELDTVRHTRLSDIIKRNTTITQIQKNVFFVPGFSQPVADPGS
ncbi:MAG TPA: peroxidase family protein [Kofleriaceae bacterium]|nr:peroxidase family protein [Kofleriaceae bacterium]